MQIAKTFRPTALPRKRAFWAWSVCSVYSYPLPTAPVVCSSSFKRYYAAWSGALRHLTLEWNCFYPLHFLNLIQALSQNGYGIITQTIALNNHFMHIQLRTLWGTLI
jgi:hypothetical protein